MRKTETRDGQNFAKTAGNTVGDLNLTPVDIEKKYGPRFTERFGVNPFDLTRSDSRINFITAL